MTSSTERNESTGATGVDEELSRVLDQILGEHALAAGAPVELDTALWTTLAGTGMAWIGLPEEQGGSGGTHADAGELARLSGYHAVAAPVVETGLAAWLLGVAGLERDDAPLTVAVDATLTAARVGDDWRIDGAAVRVPWASALDRVVVVVPVDGGELVAVLPTASAEVTPGRNLAAEPRDALSVTDAQPLAAGVVPTRAGASLARELRLRAAAGRTLQLAGAAERALDLTIAYAGQRVQFGRPLARFQAIQQLIALTAEEVALARAAAERAARALDDHARAPAGRRDAALGALAASIATAKSVAGNAAETIAAHTHQVHGAMGFTSEYPLHLATKRLWSWRDEHLTTDVWSRELARLLADAGEQRADVVRPAGPAWAFLTDSF